MNRIIVIATVLLCNCIIFTGALISYAIDNGFEFTIYIMLLSGVVIAFTFVALVSQLLPQLESISETEKKFLKDNNADAE